LNSNREFLRLWGEREREREREKEGGKKKVLGKVVPKVNKFV
jgi:hypothetical protein